MLEIKKKPPFKSGRWWFLLRQIRSIFLLKLGTMAYKWTYIYRTYGYGGKLSDWGSGSDLMQTEVIREEIPRLVNELNIRVLLDCPCGDLNWIQHVELKLEKYIGVDIVKEIIEENKQKFNKKGYAFYKMDMSKDVLPKADMILCRDCLVHFSFKDAVSTIKRFKKSGTRYLLTTTFTKRLQNTDTITGVWRPINLQLSPFNFPNPIKLINEKCSQAEGIYADKSLGLWLLEDIWKFKCNVRREGASYWKN